MWFLNVFLNILTFVRLIFLADRHFRDERPDAVVLVDYPGLHWWLARRAKARGIPVIYFVPPQIWAWAGWRVKKVKKYVDLVLCSLPFEPAWYHARGVPERGLRRSSLLRRAQGPAARCRVPGRSRADVPASWCRSCPARGPRRSCAISPRWSGPRTSWPRCAPAFASPSPACTTAIENWPQGIVASVLEKERRSPGLDIEIHAGENARADPAGPGGVGRLGVGRARAHGRSTALGRRSTRSGDSTSGWRASSSSPGISAWSTCWLIPSSSPSI